MAQGRTSIDATSFKLLLDLTFHRVFIYIYIYIYTGKPFSGGQRGMRKAK
jgi:hypothetical protein